MSVNEKMTAIADAIRGKTGKTEPLTLDQMAAEIAKTYGVRVYTIGVGTRGKAPYPALDFFGNPTTVMADVEIDEETLSEIALRTGGKYFCRK